MAAPVSAQATENNQRLFVRYAKVFRENDVVAYTVHAHKLAAWLRDSKAYYTAARPEIIKLLLIAQISLRRALGVEQEFTTSFNITNYPRNPMIDAYAHLVGTVEPYLPLFVEPALFEHIAGLVATIHSPVSSQLPDPPSQSSLSPPPFGHTPMSVPAGVAPPPSPPPLTKSSSFSDPDVQIIDNPYASISTPGSMNVSSQSAASLSTAKPLETTLKTKAKKRKSVIDFTVLAQRDIEGLMQKKQATQSATTSEVVKTMSPPATIPPDPLTLLPSSDPLKLSPESFNGVAGQSLTLQRRPTPPPLDSSEIVVQSPLSDKRMDVDASMQMNVETLHFDQLAEGQKGSREPSDKLINENLPTLVKETGECLGQLEIPANTQLTSQVEIDRSLLIDSAATKMPAIQRLPSVPPENESNRMDVDTTAASSTETHALTTTTNDTQVYGLPQSPITSGDSQVFGSEMSVIASQTGLKDKVRISIQFEIPELQFALISRWIACKISPEEVESSICLTLGCYLNDNLAKLSQIHNDCDTLEKQVSLTKSAWPSHGDLVMSVKYGDTKAILPLCPPFQITPDGLVDVSEFLSLGQNVIELNQRQDMSRYRFVLHAHYPTRSQLKELESRQKKDQSWNDWLRHISRPINIPLKPTNQAC